MQSGRSKVCYYLAKNQQFVRLINEQQQKLITIFSPEVNLDVHVIQNKYIYNLQGGSGGAEEI